MLLVSIMLFAHSTALHGHGLNMVADEKTGPLVKADDGMLGIIR